MQVDFGSSKRAVIDLNNMISSQGRRMDKSHLYIVGFWTTGGKQFRIKDVFPAMTSDAAGVDNVAEDVADPNVPVDVYDMNGRLLRSSVLPSEATEGLAPGLYIVGGRKVAKLN